MKLSESERSLIVDMIMAGRSNQEISDSLSVNKKTVAWYRYEYNLSAKTPILSARRKRPRTKIEHQQRIELLEKESKAMSDALIGLRQLMLGVRASKLLADGRIITHRQLQKALDLIDAGYDNEQD